VASNGQRAISDKETRAKEQRRLAAEFENIHGPQRRVVLVMASDLEMAIELAIREATHGDWKLRASVPKVNGEYLASQRPDSSGPTPWWVVTVVVKLPAKPVDWNWH
jgi:hypothetical protein